jgi:hypothetical protein
MGYGPYKRVAKPGAYPEGMPAALEYDGDQYPALVGMIVAYFAAIERELPTIISRMTGLDSNDAITLCAEFRAFSVKLGILSSLLKLRDETSHDRIIYTHCKGLMKEANELRNKYAHAMYGRGTVMMMLPYPNDLKPIDKWEEIPLQKIRSDKKKMSIILGQLFAILHQKELPISLYDKLLPQDR